MNIDYSHRITVTIGLTATLLCIILLLNKPIPPSIPNYNDLQAVQDNEEIRIGIFQNSTDYYLLDGAIVGFHYQLAEKMADMLDVHARFIVMPSYWDAFYALANNEVDVLAISLNYNPLYALFFDYTVPHSYSSQVLVQRKDNMLLNNDLQIILSKANTNYRLAIPAVSTFYDEALKLSLKCKVINQIVIRESIVWQDYLSAVENKTSDMAIIHSNLMRVYQSLFPHLDCSVELTKSLPLHWVVQKGNKTLLNAIDQCLDRMKTKPEFHQWMQLYYFPTAKRIKVLEQNRQKITNGYISSYDSLFKHHAAHYKIDWHLVAAIAYRESKFKPYAQGQKGAFGLMQMLPSTARHLGMQDSNSIDEQIKFACKYIKSLKDKYVRAGVNKMDIYKFVMAAYNAGQCHVDDAMYVAKVKGLNPKRWKDVEEVLIQLSNMQYIYGIKLQCGRYSGNQTVNYVRKTYILYRHYKDLIN
jgi:membrane-bound lytic murein transglycosylase F